ncbi:MAG: hypothetical protein LIR46_06115 [Bacteroidota bacterium]|nr:hypothetical protein [Bacteroidota bacterium]
MKLIWDETGTRRLEGGISEVALFPMTEQGTYGDGVAWSGVTAFNENPSGADVTDLYADNIKYASLRAAEKYGFTIEAYQYPPEWAECDGSAEVVPGVFLGQQNRKAFGLVCKTQIGDDTHPGMDKGYKLHIIYNSTASPSSRSYTTINENPDAISFSWEGNSTPVNVADAQHPEYSRYKAVSCITIDSTKVDAAKMTALETLLYGSDNASAALPSPAIVLSTIS